MAITLLPLDVKVAQRVAEGDLSVLDGASNRDDIAGMVQDAAMMQAQMYAHNTAAEAPWTGYLAREDADSRVVGVCSFHGQPQDGIVEIAYCTFPGYEGNGFGGDMATALVDLALGDDTVQAVVAHTVAEEGPATRILARLGFEHSGILDDGDGDTLWQWVLERELPA